MAHILDRFSWGKKKSAAPVEQVSYSFSISEPTVQYDPPPVQAADGPYGEIANQYTAGYFDGENYAGGLGAIQVLYTDYWALRQRSATFFKSNQYGKGLIRRFVTNVINTGLSLEADPIASLTSLNDETAAEWAENIEDRFEAWGASETMCDWAGEKTFERLQREVYREALVEGDMLVIEHFNKAMMCPQLEIVAGSSIVNPVDEAPDNEDVRLGVGHDKRGRQIAYYVAQSDGTTKRIPAYGNNGRRVAWLVYGTERRKGESRGEPLLGVVMQAIGEILKFRDSAQRKATIGALFAMYFYKDPNATGPTGKILSNGASRRQSGSVELADGTDYKINRSGFPAGTVMDNLPKGVMPKAITNDTTDEKLGDFEEAVLMGVAWSLEMPLSVVKMAFSASYSASRGEVKEFDMVMHVMRGRFADQLNRRVYRSWLRMKALGRSIEMPGYLEATRDPALADVASAWEMSNWWGRVKEAVDLPKEVSGRSAMADRGYTTNAAAARALTGTSWRKNIKRVAREAEMLAKAREPELKQRQEYGDAAVDQATSAVRMAQVIALKAVGEQNE